MGFKPSTLFVETARFSVRSYGNGLAYVLEHRGLGQDILFQGDDADTFRRELQGMTESERCTLDYDDALGAIWGDYAEMSEPTVHVTNITANEFEPPEPPFGAQPATKCQIICTTCGSTNVALDAWAKWDVEAQDWVLGDTYDDQKCLNCEAEGHRVIESVPLKDVPRFVVEPQRDHFKDYKDDGTWFLYCEEDQAEHFALLEYKPDVGEYELVEDFPTREEAEARAAELEKNT